MAMTLEDRREQEQAFVTGLFALARYVKRHAELLDDSTLRWGGVTIRVSVTADQLPDCLRRMGSFEKVATDYSIGGMVDFGPHAFQLTADRDEVCERVPTGETKHVSHSTTQGDEIPDGAFNVRTVTEVKVLYDTVEPVTEYKCPPSLLDLSVVADDES